MSDYPVDRPRRTVCFFIGSISGRGGTERVASLIGNGLAREGFKVLVLSLFQGRVAAYPVEESIALHELYSTDRQFKWRYPQIVMKLRRFLKEEKVDILISTDSILALYSVASCARLPTFHIVWEHFNFLSNFNLLSRRIARYLAAYMASAVVVLTGEDRELWIKKTGGTAPVVVISNPLPFAAAVPLSRSWKSKSALAIGRLHSQKGFDLLIQAWKKVVLRLPGWNLRIIGEGPEEDMLKNLIEAEGLSGKVEMLPFTDKIADYYRKASFFCLSSRFEGLPMVLLEAQAFGLPAVAFDCSTGPREIVENGVNGFLVAENDVEAFSERLIQLAESEDLRREQGQRAAAMIRRFEKDAIIGQWESLLSSSA